MIQSPLALNSAALPNVIISNGRAITLSTDVAQYFGKLHKNVIQKIESLDCSGNFTKLNFQPSEYTDSTGRKLPMYEMTKDGFIFLVMGFTGKKALNKKHLLTHTTRFGNLDAPRKRWSFKAPNTAEDRTRKIAVFLRPDEELQFRREGGYPQGRPPGCVQALNLPAPYWGCFKATSVRDVYLTQESL